MESVKVKVFSRLPNIPTKTNFQVRFFILIRIDFWLFYHINIYLHFESKLSFQERKYHHIYSGSHHCTDNVGSIKTQQFKIQGTGSGTSIN